MLPECLALTILVAPLAPWSAVGAGVPDSIAGLGRLTDASGQPVSDGDHEGIPKSHDASGPLWASSPIALSTAGGPSVTRIPSVPASVFSGNDVSLEAVVDGERKTADTRRSA
jgi:hypothetical protein